MNSLWQDIRYGARSLLKRPGFTLIAVLTLALGIGSVTAIFSVVHALMFRTLDVPNPDRLVSIVSRGAQFRFYLPVSFPDYRDYKALSDVFEDVSAFSPSIKQITFEGKPERIMITLVTGNYFEVLKLNAQRGRVFDAGEGDIGGGPYIVLSHGYWQSRFGADPSIIGRSVSFNGLPVTVIGVTPESFEGTVGLVSSAAYVPFSTFERIQPKLKEALEDRSAPNWRTVARLKPGVGIEEARAAVMAKSITLESEYPETNKELRAFVFPEPLTRLEPAAADFMPLISTIFMILVGLVLVVACANVANLLLVRAAGRTREVAIRSALGAGRLRVVRQLLTESLLLATLGGIAALGVSYLATSFLSSIRVASDLPLQFNFAIDGRVFLVFAAITVGAGLLAGLAPGLKTVRMDLTDSLKEGGRGGDGAARQPLRAVLVVGQVAISLVLLISTGLFMQSMVNVRAVDPGFETKDRVMMTVDTALRNYENAQAETFFAELLRRVRGLPGVESAATAYSVPVGFDNVGTRVYLEGEARSGEDEQSLLVLYNIVSSDYFSTLGVRMLKGRPIGENDAQQSLKTAVVNQRMSEMMWPEQEAIGKRFSIEGADGPFVTVVGVSANGFYSVPGERPQPYFYLPYLQNPIRAQTLFIHSRNEPTSQIASVRKAIAALDADMPIFDVRTLKTHFEDGKAAILFRLPAALLGAFALIGAVLAATGLYGVISYSVTQRTHEIGIRMALGATSGTIVRLFSGKGLRLAAVGVVIGLAAAFFVTRIFAGVLVGVSASDPWTYGWVSVLVLLTAFVASSIPARFRAAAIDPVNALRGE